MPGGETGHARGECCASSLAGIMAECAVVAFFGSVKITGRRVAWYVYPFVTDGAHLERVLVRSRPALGLSQATRSRN